MDFPGVIRGMFTVTIPTQNSTPYICHATGSVKESSLKDVQRTKVTASHIIKQLLRDSRCETADELDARRKIRMSGHR